MRPSLRAQLSRAAIPALIVAGLAIIVVAGFLARDGDEPLVGQPALEAIFPLDDAQVVAQDRVGVDLQPGWSGQLSINGTAIPSDQLDQDNGLNQLVFRPGPGKVITALRQNRNCAEIIFWQDTDGRGSAAPPRRWCFNVL